jgi:Uma2 family endonuclease
MGIEFMSGARRLPTSPCRITVENYLAIERAAPVRHEYYDGEIVAMAGESLAHGIICQNIGGLLYVQLKGTPCFAVAKDTKVRSGLGVASSRSTSGMFSYPDILVVCGEAEFFDDQSDVIVNPTAIIEVLSKSTESYDRGEKFQRYRAWNATLVDYVLVSQSKPFIEHFRRQADDTWLLSEAAGLETALAVPTISCKLNLADVYDRIVFPEAQPELGG